MGMTPLIPGCNTRESGWVHVELEPDRQRRASQSIWVLELRTGADGEDLPTKEASMMREEDEKTKRRKDEKTKRQREQTEY